MLRISLLLLMLLVNLAYSAPQQIIIVRHGDKLVQPKPGPTLSAEGILRSIRLAQYFEKTYGDPDVIIASNPIEDNSIRELQTIAPLANIVASHHPQQGFPIWHPYPNIQYSKLAHALLTESRFNNKRILICWDHKLIPQLTHLLGVNEKLNKWPRDDFDTVFIIDYNTLGKVKKFTMLHHQYNIKGHPTFEELYAHM